MKKFLITLGIIVGSWVLIQEIRSVEFTKNGKASQDHPISLPSHPEVLTKVKKQIQPVTEDLEREQIPDLYQLHREYVNYKKDEIEQELQKSANLISRNHLIQKANQGQLSHREEYQLLTEMRRQSVLRMILAKNQMADLKRKHL